MIAREDGYTYIAALRSPDLRHTTKRKGDSVCLLDTSESVTVVTSNFPFSFFLFSHGVRRRRLHPRKSVAPERASRASSPGFWFLPWCRGSPAGGRATRGQVRAGTLHARAMQLFVRSTAGRTLALEVERDSPVRPQRRQPLPAYAGCSCVRANCRPKCRVGWRVLTGARGAAGACSKGVSGGA